jgi:tagaturonate reductase
MALGFAAYLRFMQSSANEQGQYTGQANGKDYLINDDKAAVLHTLTQGKPHAALVQQTLADESLWGRNLNTLPGFADAVTLHLQNILAAQSNSRNVLEYVKQLF